MLLVLTNFRLYSVDYKTYGRAYLLQKFDFEQNLIHQNMSFSKKTGFLFVLSSYVTNKPFDGHSVTSEAKQRKSLVSILKTEQDFSLSRVLDYRINQACFIIQNHNLSNFS